MRGYPFGIRRDAFDVGFQNHDESETNEMPHLLNSSSGSSLTQDSPRNKEESHRRSKKHHRGDAQKNKILRGAEILRRQLIADNEDVDDEDDDSEYTEHEPIHTLSREELTEGDVSEDAEEWSDPWTPKSRHTRAGSLADAEEKTAFSSPVGDAAEWARLSDDEGDHNDGGHAKQRKESARRQHRSRRISPEHSPETRKDADPWPRQKSPYSRPSALKVDHHEEDFREPSLRERNYLPGGLRNVSKEPSNMRAAYFPPSPTNWENSSEAVSSHALDLLKDLESEERALQQLNCDEEMSYLLDASKEGASSIMMTVPVAAESPKFPNVVSPRSQQFEKLERDPAYQHAKRAGMLWQSLLSQHVRFPSTWWNGARSPPMGVAERRMWTYMGRHRVGGNQYLNGLVKSRGSAGRLVLHLVVRDIVTMAPVQDIAVGCFHPNARGIRTTTAFDPTIEESRDIWIALRKRGDDVSVMESLLKQGGDDDISESPLGGKHAVNNNNMRAVFGETPPVQTVFVLESELYEVFSHFMDNNIPPAAILLGRYLKDWY